MTEPLTLYVVPASHPCIAVEAALQLKGLDYSRVDLMFGVSAAQQMLRFGRRTVPGLTVGSQRIVGSRLIMRALDGFAPEPALVPADPDARAAVDAADEWGDLVLQEQVRWIVLLAAENDPDAFASFTEGYQVPKLPSWLLKRAGVGVRLEMKLLGYSVDQVQNEWLPSLPGHLDHVDGLIADGVIGGETPNVADLQIASSVRLLMNFEDLAEHIAARPAGQLAQRLIPSYPGSVPRGAMRSPFA